ncbi:MAG: DUF1614 domain-containing protein [Selenomonadaceae bacterium]|nr:DUF1614 domain-containing protein [Selenomonadaceae bacterium]
MPSVKRGNFKSRSVANSSAKSQPADSSIATETEGATSCPTIGTSLEISFAMTLTGCCLTVATIALIAMFLATDSVIEPPKTAASAIAIVVMVTVSVASPTPGTGIKLPAAAAELQCEISNA